VAKTALITGISGQDGAYLARALLARGYRVVGAFRRTSGTSIGRLEELGISGEVELVDMELLEESNLRHVLNKLKPDEIYNLAAQSFVGLSFEQPLYTSDIDALGVLRLLESMREVCAGARFYQASTSEMFGKAQETPQNEKTPFYPRSPYGVAKLFAHWSVVNYREAHGLYACSGILFNHESPLRGRDFVTRKVTFGLARVALGQEEMVHIGNLEARRDWGFAGEYVEGMWMMLQQDRPGDYVLATGRSNSVRHFIDGAAAGLGFDIEWTGRRRSRRRPAERPHHRRRRSKTLPAGRGRCARRRCAQSQGRPRLGSKDQPRRPHPDDGQGRLRPREVRRHPLLSRGWRRRRAYRFTIAPQR
jgi:GDPmannose 4,6-dehydratase